MTRHTGMRDSLGPAPTNVDWIARFAVVAVVLGFGGPDAEPTIVRAIEARAIVERLPRRSAGRICRVAEALVLSPRPTTPLLLPL